MRPINWTVVFVVAALLGVIIGYIFTLIYRPTLLPPALRLGSLMEPTTVLLLGTDVVYTDLGNRNKKADQSAFTGRSDTILVARLDPYANSFGVVSIPRDTQVTIPGNGVQKINAANAIGGPQLAVQTVSQFMQIPIDHYVVLNVHGLVEMVNELGGITVEIPKRMHYMDWTAKLKIDLEPGYHTLTGNQAMGFVRFRHDELGDIGRVQRQQMFLRAVMQKALSPESWAHLPKLMEIASRYIQTDMSVQQMISMANFARGVPKTSQFFAMLPGDFSGNDWVSPPASVRRMVARLMGSSFVTADRNDIPVTVENDSSVVGLGTRVSKLLREQGYTVTLRTAEQKRAEPLQRTRIIAQKANPEEAELVKRDLHEAGDIVNASIGDIRSSVTVLVGNDLEPLVTNTK
ncbi:MAG TPA: LCP family protein [Chroococcales cyanobacterium]